MIPQQILSNCPLANLSHHNNDINSKFFSAFPIINFHKGRTTSAMIHSRRDFYKIVLISGHATYFYGDRQESIAPGHSALVFTNRDVPYRWEIHSGACEGFSCIFADDFLPLHTYLRPADWSVFDSNGQCFFHLDQDQTSIFKSVFEKIIQEQSSTYANKYNLIFIYLLECIHIALKLCPASPRIVNSPSGRITEAFYAILSEQFPAGLGRNERFRTARDFADQIGIHVNYLNRTLKTTTGKTTTQLIAERTIQQARALLLYSDDSISQISYRLGFEEPTHFAQFFHKHTQLTPSSLRQI